jgi:hypothetical protein
MLCSSIQKLVFAGVLCSAASAHANLLVNGSFEEGTFNPPFDHTVSPGVGSTIISGWTVINGSISWIDVGNPFGLSASAGSKFLDLTDYRDSVPFGGVTQSLSTIAGATYLLTFDLGSSDRYGRPASIQASAGNATATFSSGPLTTGNNVYEPQALTFIATSSLTTVTLLGVAGQQNIGLDNVDVSFVSAPVPEPSTYALMLCGVGLVGAAARRRRG